MLDFDQLGVVFLAGLLDFDEAGVRNHQHRPHEGLFAGSGGGDSGHDLISPCCTLVDQETDPRQADGEEEDDQENQTDFGEQIISHGKAPSAEWM